MRTTLKLNQIVDEWIRDVDASTETQKDYRRKIELWFRWLSAQGINPREPTREQVFHYKDHLKAQGKSRFTYLSYVAVVKLFYKFCSQRSYWNDIGAGIASSIRQKGHNKNPLKVSQAERLLNSIDTETIVGKRDKLIIALMLTNGLRTCEVHRIDICDFEKLDSGKTILHIQRKGHSEKDDYLAVNEFVEPLFEDYIACRDFDITDPLIINHKKGVKPTRLSKQGISLLIKQRLRAVGINDPKITAHSLRHTCGSLLVARGVDIELIKDLLGHSSTSTTRIYIDQAQKQRLIDIDPGGIVAELFNKKSKR